MTHQKHTRETLEPVVRNSQTCAEVCRKLGLKPRTGNQSHIKVRAKKFGIDFSHFVGQAYWRGKKLGPKHPLEYYLTETGSTIKSPELR